MHKETLNHYRHAAACYPWRTGVSFVNPIITVLLTSFAGPFIIAQFFNQLQNDTLSLDSAKPLIILYALVQLYGEVIGWRLTLYSMWTAQTAAQRDLYSKIFDHLSGLSISFHNDRFGGSLVSQTSKFVNGFERIWDTVVFNAIPLATSIIAATVILSFSFWQYAVVLFAFSILFIFTVLISHRKMAQLNTSEAQASTALTGRLADMVTNISAVKSFGNEKRELQRYEQLTTVWRGRALDTMSAFLKVSTIYSIITMALNVTALVAALIAVEQDIIAAGTVYLSVTYTFTVARQLWEMNHIMRSYNRVIGDAYDMTQILALKPDVQDVSETTEITNVNGAINFEHMSFTHGDTNKNEVLFEDFKLDIKPGERIGLVGHSGSGKTTLTKLLLRFDNLDKGHILIDEIDIATMPQTVLRKYIAYVPQEPLLFHRSLHENIAYGKPDASRQEVIEAAKKANALEFIEKLPDTFETLVGERGVKLSGGQRQRVAIARAILKDAPILILDEATSALDSESENLIQSALWELMKDRTAIVIAHRLSTIQKMDRIVVLDNGKIVEQGSHTELLSLNKVYASLWRRQSGGFIEE